MSIKKCRANLKKAISFFNKAVDNLENCMSEKPKGRKRRGRPPKNPQ